MQFLRLLKLRAAARSAYVNLIDRSYLFPKVTINNGVTSVSKNVRVRCVS